jgi:hypothetical protein
VKFVHGIREQPWRQKVMRFYDPDGKLKKFPNLQVCRRILQGSQLPGLNSTDMEPKG